MINEHPYIMKHEIDIAALFAGCFTFSSALLLWITLSKQRISYEKQSIENHFYKMLEIARDNSESMRSKGREGRYVFKRICDDFDEIYKTIDNYCRSYNGNENHPSKSDKISISWLIVFYGLSSKTLPVLQLAISKISKVISSEQNLHVYELRKLSDVNDDNGWLKYDGFQSTLAHYFRHLFQTVRYINEQSILSYDEKYHYIRTLRAQLNTFELMILFYNCFSPYGKEWEPYLHSNSYDLSVDNFLGYSNSIKTVRDCRNELVNYDEYINKQLITKYQIFRNITMPLGNNLEVKDFFPMIEYEHIYSIDHITERDKLDEIYRK